MPITVKADFWGNNFAFIQDQSNFRKIIARMFNLKENRRDRALLNSLVGAAAGSNATATLKRVQHSRTELGGKRVIETETLVNRNTTAQDVTDLKAKILAYRSQPVSYPTDKAKRW